MEFRTCDSVMAHIEKCVREKIPLSPHDWIEAAEYLNILSSEPQERLYDLEKMVADARLQCVTDGHNGVTTKAIIEASTIFREMKSAIGKVKRVEQAIMLAKKHATLADWK